MTQLDSTAVLPPIEEDSPRFIDRSRPPSDRVFAGVMYVAGILVLVIMAAVGVFLGYQLVPTLQRYGLHFITDKQFDPQYNQAGIRAAIFGTIEVALVAIVVAFPFALLTALFITEYAPRRAKSFLISMIDLMAAIPSLVYAAWGYFLLLPHLLFVSRWLDEWFGWIPIFKVPGVNPRDPAFAQSRFNQSIFEAGIVVAMMVIPLACSVMRNVFDQAPLGEREGALALGATRFGMIRAVVLPFGRGGIIGGMMLGLGRALGETIAVLVILSQSFNVSVHLLQGGGLTISGLIANQFGDANGARLSALLAAGFVLFLMTLVVNTFAATIVGRSRSGAGVDI